MIEGFSECIISHKDHAHWIIFATLLLAGFNIPISIDIVLICSAFLAAQIIPEYTLQLFAASVIGCVLSAWIAYWLGRTAGPKIAKFPLLRRILNPKKVEKIRCFYKKHGLWTFVIGRFIPFGIRNCIFFSSGLSRMPFRKFILYDGMSCAIWASAAFTIFYFACANYTSLISHVKIINICIFSVFVVALISSICYKKKKKFTE